MAASFRTELPAPSQRPVSSRGMEERADQHSPQTAWRGLVRVTEAAWFPGSCMDRLVFLLPLREVREWHGQDPKVTGGIQHQGPPQGPMERTGSSRGSQSSTPAALPRPPRLSPTRGRRRPIPGRIQAKEPDRNGHGDTSRKRVPFNPLTALLPPPPCRSFPSPCCSSEDIEGSRRRTCSSMTLVRVSFQRSPHTRALMCPCWQELPGSMKTRSGTIS